MKNISFVAFVLNRFLQGGISGILPRFVKFIG